MPLTHIRTFRVRHCECDAYGHVNHAQYLRYMQETAFDASAAAGYDLDRYQAMRCTWLIRETQIEYLRPLRYGDIVQVLTWVADFRRVRSRRAYEIHLASSGELAARAATDWAFLDSDTGQPAVIPQELKAAFMPEGVSDVGRQGERFPLPPPAPPAAFRHRRRVEWRDLDQVGHVNHAVYFSYVEGCGLQMVAACGWPLARMMAGGFAVVARQHRIGYRLPGLLDDELEVATWLSHVEGGGTTALRHTLITRVSDGALLSRARTVHVWLSLDTGRPTPIPEALLADLAPSIAGSSGL